MKLYTYIDKQKIFPFQSQLYFLRFFKSRHYVQILGLFVCMLSYIEGVISCEHHGYYRNQFCGTLM